MSNTGVTVNDQVISSFNEMKLRQTSRYITYKLSDDLKEIVIDAQGDPSASYDDFLARLPDDDCRYAVDRVDYSMSDGERSKLVFYLWAPDTAKVKSRMLYAGCKDSLKTALNGINAEIQGTDRSEVELSAVIEKLKSIQIY